MSGNWIQDCKKILDQIKELDDLKEQDRLDMVRTIRFTLFALQRSLSGWLEWINNPDIMSSFSLEELKEISKNLAKLTQPFIEYDCKITSSYQEDLTVRTPSPQSRSPKEERDKTKIFYVN